MRSVYAALCATIVGGLLSGCGPKESPATGQGGAVPPTLEVKAAPANQSGKGTNPAKPDLEFPKTTKRSYQGGNAAYWGPLLHDAEPFVAGDAIVGVFNCGDEGLRFAYDAMCSGNATIRSNGAAAISPEGSKYVSLLLPKLTEMLGNPESKEWESAALAVVRCNFKTAESVLRSAAGKATDDGLKKTLTAYADELKAAKK